MSDKYTAEQYETEALVTAKAGALGWSRMLRQSAQMMREREVGGAVTDEDVECSCMASCSIELDCSDMPMAKWEHMPEVDRKQARKIIRAALESFASPRAAVPDAWRSALRNCADCLASAITGGKVKAYQAAQAIQDAEALLAAAPEVTK